MYNLFPPEQIAALFRDSTTASAQHRPYPDKPLDELSIAELRVVVCYMRVAYQNARNSGVSDAVLYILEDWYYEAMGLLMPHDGLLQSAVVSRKHIPISRQGDPSTWDRIDAMLPNVFVEFPT